ncbi:MAG: hypothetical protein E6929_17485 [Clostridium sp.]|nr:hypothetical protein [Clostridium sp.]
MKRNKRKLLCLLLVVIAICLTSLTQINEDRDISDIGYLNSNDMLSINISHIYIII